MKKLIIFMVSLSLTWPAIAQIRQDITKQEKLKILKKITSPGIFN
ncbi:hypothetical protein [Pedobacter sp. CFBP9032]|nr:hypothetical protein [Pedobacter sp. CFBP9032]MDY0907466.1 hypothetical protein [Pedobacter sp. CFBP9032]